ncbi:hypothetical protein DPEC_G00059240 [Dallia pectoralis]|uniref:Uncharacterized protein n=1 Tax=Dallia pectoralis TaxID=75939 RepID=A0ACC2H706_DALPE|nr:hypothetical protein DPEC_G00059240 [Dallia pectoralis]
MSFERQQNRATQRQPATVPTPRVSSESHTHMPPQMPDFATYMMKERDESRQLRKLGDLLLELESAKWSGLTPGLAYLETARGVNPIVEKLPFNLQERWMTQGSRYKEDHKVAFPPFSSFVQFICNKAKTRNDPSFAFSSLNYSNSQTAKPDGAARFSHKPSVFVKRTKLSATAQSSLNNQSDEN